MIHIIHEGFFFFAPVEKRLVTISTLRTCRKVQLTSCGFVDLLKVLAILLWPFWDGEFTWSSKRLLDNWPQTKEWKGLSTNQLLYRFLERLLCPIFVGNWKPLKPATFALNIGHLAFQVIYKSLFIICVYFWSHFFQPSQKIKQANKPKRFGTSFVCEERLQQMLKTEYDTLEVSYQQKPWLLSIEILWNFDHFDHADLWDHSKAVPLYLQILRF